MTINNMDDYISNYRKSKRELQYIYESFNNRTQLTQNYSQSGGDNVTKENTQPVLNYSEPSKIDFYKVPAGTELYHGSFNKNSFNPYNIRLGDDTLIAYFTPSKRLASDYIMGCAGYPEKSGGFIHKFKVKKDINNILVVSRYDKKASWTKEYLEQKFCSTNLGLQFNFNKVDGVAFFYPKGEEEEDIKFEVEFALCNPNEYLEYVSTRSCVATRKLSEPYSFPL
jgi:hypothetical protein